MKTPQFSHEEIEAARGRQPSLNGPVDPGVICAVAGLLFEKGINEILHMPDEEKEWQQLSDHGRRHLDEAVWFLGRMQAAGFTWSDSEASDGGLKSA